MVNKKQFKKMAQKVFRTSKGIQSPKIMHPSRDWSVGVLIAVILFGSSVTWGVVKFNEYNNLTVDGNFEVEVVVYNEQIVNDSLEVLSNKSDKYERLVQKNIIYTEVEETTSDSEEEVDSEEAEQTEKLEENEIETENNEDLNEEVDLEMRSDTSLDGEGDQ